MLEFLASGVQFFLQSLASGAPWQERFLTIGRTQHHQVRAAASAVPASGSQMQFTAQRGGGNASVREDRAEDKHSHAGNALPDYQ